MTSRLLPVLPPRLDLDTVAALSRVHPQLVERFVAMDLVPARRDSAGKLWFAPAAPARIRRVVRLHADLALNYSAVALVLDLLDRIDVLESRRWPVRLGKESPPWR